MIVNSEKKKMEKKSYTIFVSPTDSLKNFTPTQLFPNFILRFKQGAGGGRKLMPFHLKIYVILFNSIYVFLLEHIDVFWMFLLLPAIKNKKQYRMKQNIGNQSYPKIERDQKTHGNFSNQINLQESLVSGNSKFWGCLTLLIIHFKYTSRSYTSLASFFIKMPT